MLEPPALQFQTSITRRIKYLASCVAHEGLPLFTADGGVTVVDAALPALARKNSVNFN